MEENGRQNVQKDGVDFLIKQGYKKVSAKTFISDVDLELFLNKDFTNINKTRALGFIQILEREYDVDLQDLKDSYLAHNNANKPKKVEKLFIEEAIIENPPWQKYLPLIAGLLAALGLAYYLFRPTVETVEPVVQPIEENISIKQAEKNIKKLEKNESEKLSNSTLENSLNTTKTKKEQENNGSTSTALSPTDDLDLDKVVLQMMKDRNISSSDKEETAEDTNTTAKQAEQNSTTKIAESDINTSKEKEVEKKEPKKKVVKKSTKKLDKLANIPLAKTIPIEKFKEQKRKNEKTTKKAISGKGLFISPIQKAWVGVIYLDDFSKKDFLIRGKLPLNSNRDQLIVVGHNKFKIYNKTYSVKFRSRGPVRFIYQDGELMEINKKEFMRTSAGVAW